MNTGLFARIYKHFGSKTILKRFILPSKIKGKNVKLAIFVLNKDMQGRRLFGIYMDKGNCTWILKHQNEVVTCSR